MCLLIRKPGILLIKRFLKKVKFLSWSIKHFISFKATSVRTGFRTETDISILTALSVSLKPLTTVFKIVKNNPNIIGITVPSLFCF